MELKHTCPSVLLGARRAFNRTSMELKLIPFRHRCRHRCRPFNRTSMELKLSSCRLTFKLPASFNRTSMELKQTSAWHSTAYRWPFNRTSMELKRWDVNKSPIERVNF